MSHYRDIPDLNSAVVCYPIGKRYAKTHYKKKIDYPTYPLDQRCGAVDPGYNTPGNNPGNAKLRMYETETPTIHRRPRRHHGHWWGHYHMTGRMPQTQYPPIE